jgi:hypothetical protein
MDDLYREFWDRHGELKEAEEAYKTARSGYLRALLAFAPVNARHLAKAAPRLSAADQKARLAKLRAEILEDHARNFETMSAVLDTSEVVARRGLQKVAEFVAKLHPAVVARLDEECPGTSDDKGGLPRWSAVPREALRTLDSERLLPTGEVRKIPKSARGGQNKQRARNEFLRRLAEAYRACGMNEDGLLPFLNKAAAEARPPVPCPATLDGLYRFVPKPKPASERA